jgi:hypothetical protein
MKNEKSGWSSPSVLVAIAALTASVIWNIVQYGQNTTATPQS